VFVRVFEDKSDSEIFSTLMSIIGLSLVFISLSLVPIDIFLVSSTTNSLEGIKYDWGTMEYIAGTQKVLSVSYYLLFGLMSLFSFVLIPFAYFYFEEWDEGVTVREV
jgi:LMBR1 domain-containing protein 1